MVTQPLGDSGVILRPFVTADFQGGYNFDQEPSAGLKVEYRPSAELNFAVTQLVGPGFVLYGGRPLRAPYPQGAYGFDAGAVVENWQGPNFVAESDSTLYFIDARAEWRARPDLMLSAEFLYGTTRASWGGWWWQGFLLMADYDVSDRLHVYGRWSVLDDPDWLVTGIFQTRQEVSVGAGYHFPWNVEVRGEYRHDFSNATEDVDTVSIHLTVKF
jgi:hypothetical protein